PGKGPSEDRPVRLDFTFSEPVTIDAMTITPRPQYGPRDCRLFVAEESTETSDFSGASGWRKVASFSMDREQSYIEKQKFTTTKIRLEILSAYDPRFPESPRNAQISEVTFSGPRFVEPRRPIRDLGDRMCVRELPWSAPKSEHLLTDVEPIEGEQDCDIQDEIALTSLLKDGRIEGPRPEGMKPGRWTIVRIGYTVAPGAKVSTCTPGRGGLCIDYMDPAEMRNYWSRAIEPLCELAGEHVGTTWKYCHTDSWELGGINWTPRFAEEFLSRRGYDITPWLPVLAGKIVVSRDASNRFLCDFRRTIADCVVSHHYDVMNQLAAEHGLMVHPESGGPHGAPLDGLMAIGHSDIPMMEFWAKSKTHRVKPEDRHFCKQGSSAANIYGRRLVQAEGFTTVGPHWEETLWDNLRPTFDMAATEGLNRLVWHTFTCSPESAGLPGQVYFAGTHCEPQVTWWPYAQYFFDYLNRSQFLLQQGVASADVLYYYGDWIPNFVRGRKDDPAGVLPGYDWDVTNEEALLRYAGVNESGDIVFPGGAVYRILVLPPQPCASLASLRKVEELVRRGATVVGTLPIRTTGLVPENGVGVIRDTLVTEITERIRRGVEDGTYAGRVIEDRTARQV
ncbi:MAG: glycosyl hydrolase, partial [Planctomycetia bacterium]|nr:glycosyl hydrolase [Planctomycetia bacterium]